MGSISSIGNDTSMVSSTRQENTASLSAASTENDSELADTSSQPEESIEISTRAQKIQKLNEEFFPSGPQSVEITSAFIERLHEYGLISEDDANRLSPLAKSADDQTTGAVGELLLFIDDFSERLKTSDPEDSLIATLQKGKSLLENLDILNPADITADIKTVISELTEYSNSEDSQALATDDQEALQKLTLALQIADTLNSGGMGSQKIGSYLSVLDHSQ